MVALTVVVLNERLDLGFQVAWQIVVFEYDAVLQGLVPTFDLTLRLRMQRRTANMAHIFVSKVFS